MEQYNETHQQKALRLVYQYVEDDLIQRSITHAGFEVMTVWFCKTLQNWKAVIITTLDDSKIYEVSYDGDKRQAYIDEYDKINNVCIPDEGVQPKMPRFSTSDRVTVTFDGDLPSHGIQFGNGNVQTNTYNTTLDKQYLSRPE